MPPHSPPRSIRFHLRQLDQLSRRPRLTFSHHRRLLATSAAPSTVSSPARTKSYAALPHRRLLSLSGPDASTFLQGLTTTNIPSSLQSQGGSGFFSAFLNAGGRVLYDVFIYPTKGSKGLGEIVGGDRGFLIEVDAREAQALAAHLKKFRLRRKVEVSVLGGIGDERKKNLGVYAVWSNKNNPESQENNGELAKPLDTEHIGCIDSRAPGFGHRLILPATYDSVDLDATEVPTENYHLRRFLRGIPEGQTEIPKENALPLESNLDLMGGVDFRKGCYVGQELTIRTHHTGVVRKRILPVAVYQSGERAPEKLEELVEEQGRREEIALPPAGANIGRAGGGRGRNAGKWIGGMGRVGLALCRLEVMTDSVVGESNQWKPEEFKIAWDGGEVMVKAFLPAWFRERAEGLRTGHRGGT